MKTFNSRNGAERAKTLNYPHVPIAGGQVAVWNSAEEYLSSNDVTQLANSGWKRSAWDGRRLAQKSSDKLHFLYSSRVMTKQTRRRWRPTEALYILTLKDARWGVQAGSSFLGITVKGSAF